MAQVQTTTLSTVKRSPLNFLYKHGTLLAILVVIAYFSITLDRFFDV